MARRDSSVDSSNDEPDDQDDRVPSGGRSPDVAELLRFLAKSLVDRPEQVHVALVEERSANVFELEVSDEDLGKVIGRGGKTARALRAIVQAAAPRSRKRTMVEILE